MRTAWKRAKTFASQWRYLDLRRPRMARNLALRSRTAMAIRNELASQGFLEVETPILTKSTPEGARELSSFLRV